VRISRALYDRIVEHARAEAPNECVGLIGARDGEAVEVIPAINAAHSPLRYEIDAAEQIRIWNTLDELGLELGAIYHSHTRSEPYPSQTDVNLAFYPEALYVIVGLDGEEPDVRAFRIVERQISDAPLEVRDG
jgi:[CysO sulfur-carrier protein]-S-L-cysteine hydrolase